MAKTKNLKLTEEEIEKRRLYSKARRDKLTEQQKEEMREKRRQKKAARSKEEIQYYKMKSREYDRTKREVIKVAFDVLYNIVGSRKIVRDPAKLKKWFAEYKAEQEAKIKSAAEKQAELAVVNHKQIEQENNNQKKDIAIRDSVIVLAYNSCLKKTQPSNSNGKNLIQKEPIDLSCPKNKEINKGDAEQIASNNIISTPTDVTLSQLLTQAPLIVDNSNHNFHVDNQKINKTDCSKTKTNSYKKIYSDEKISITCVTTSCDNACSNFFSKNVSSSSSQTTYGNKPYPSWKRGKTINVTTNSQIVSDSESFVTQSKEHSNLLLDNCLPSTSTGFRSADTFAAVSGLMQLQNQRYETSDESSTEEELFIYS